MTDERREEGGYTFTNGWTMKREPSHPFWWVLRDEKGVEIDVDKYRHDILERHHLTIASEPPVEA